MIWCTTSQVSSSHLSLIFLFPSRHLPWLVPGHQVSSSLHLFSVVVMFLLVCFHSSLGLHLPQGGPQSIPYGSYIHVHTLSGGLSCGGLIAANGGEDKVDQEPRLSSEHQIVWTIPSNCRLGGIVGHALFQPNEMASQLFCLLPAS